MKRLLIIFVMLLTMPCAAHTSELLCAILKLKPDAKFEGGSNASSIAMLQERYIGDDFPPISEILEAEIECNIDIAKDIKQRELNAEALKRAQIHYLGVGTGIFKLVRDTILSIKTESRDLQPHIISVNAIETARSSSSSAIDNYTAIGSLNAFDPITGLP